MADLIEREPLLAKMFPCAAKRQVEEAPAVNRWIPCSEKMPEDDKEVLCYSKHWGLGTTTKEHFALFKVTHWMPLPEPPEFEDSYVYGKGQGVLIEVMPE